MSQPRRHARSGIVHLRTGLSRNAQHVGDASGGTFVVAGERDADMRVVENGGVLTISLDELVQRLRDQTGLDPVPANIGEGVLKEVQFAQLGKLIQHQEDAPSVRVLRCDLGQAFQDLVDHEAQQRLQP